MVLFHFYFEVFVISQVDMNKFRFLCYLTPVLYYFTKIPTTELHNVRLRVSLDPGENDETQRG
jgi:hypothetical protein